MLLDGRTAIVTGAGSGVGRASALRFAEEGARVLCVDINLDQAKEAVSEIETAGGIAAAALCDVSVEEDVVAAVSTAVERFGELSIMFNNVGIPTPRLGSLLEDHTVEDFERLTSVNIRGVFLGSKHAVIRFKSQGKGGVILNTGSVAGLVGWGGSVYGATKGAVHQLTHAVARSKEHRSVSGQMPSARLGCRSPTSWQRVGWIVPTSMRTPWASRSAPRILSADR